MTKNPQQTCLDPTKTHQPVIGASHIRFELVPTKQKLLRKVDSHVIMHDTR